WPAGCQPIAQPVLEMARYGLELSERVEGAFRLTLGPVLHLWGLGPRSRCQRVATAGVVAAVRAPCGHPPSGARGGALCDARDAGQVEFNSSAAGPAVDRIVRLLRVQGIGSYLVEVTGELKAEGRKPDGAPWRIAIEAPQTDVRAV